jgi:hypothetical protein
MSQREIIAFVHIEKAAGTTLNHLLRLNYFPRYCDVRPLSYTSKGVFGVNDMKRVFAINPAVKCISGHAIRPFANLCDLIPKIRYITLLRDPLYRYISHYQFWVEKLQKKITFDQFLDLKNTFNFQTKKIAGTEDLYLAKDILARRFFLVGLVEEFDRFLILLKKNLEPFNFCPGYRVQRIGDRKSIIRRKVMDNLNYYHDRIIKANLLDIELYKFARDELIPKEIEKYGSDFENDVRTFTNSRPDYSRKLVRYIEYLFRKCYYEPIFGCIRVFNGLPAKGSY